MVTEHYFLTLKASSKDQGVAFFDISYVGIPTMSGKLVMSSVLLIVPNNNSLLHIHGSTTKATFYCVIYFQETINLLLLVKQ